MSTELESAIREALHADEIDLSDLRQPVLRGRRRGGRRTPRVLATLASAAVVAGIAVAVSVVGSGGPGGSHTPAASSGTGFLLGLWGHRWNVTTVRDVQGEFAVPASLRPWIGFATDRDGRHVAGDDTVNAVIGTVTPAPGGYRVTDGGSTFVGYDGRDPVRVRVIRAVDAMFYTVATDPEATPPPPRIAVHLSDDGRTLILRHGAVTLTLTRGAGFSVSRASATHTTSAPPPGTAPTQGPSGTDASVRPPATAATPASTVAQGSNTAPTPNG